MKNKISLLILAFVAAIGFNACTDDDNFRFQTVENPDRITLLNEFLPEYVLGTETGSNIAERFIWASPDFGAQTAVTYLLENSADGTFEDAQLVTESSTTQASITVAQMLSIANAKGISNVPQTDEDDNPILDEEGNQIINNTGELFFRVRAILGTQDATNSPEATSETIVLNVRILLVGDGETGCTPPALRQLFLVGNATAADWNNNNNNMPLVRDPNNENSYTFTGRFLGGDTNQFKFLETRGQWQPQWGLEGGVLASSDDLGGDPDIFTTAGDTGFYTVNVDLDAPSFEMVAFDASTAPTYGSISIIGSSTPLGWDGDTEMTQSSFDVHKWFISGIELVDGAAKFRTTGDWDTNWGSNTALSGFGDFGGADIPVECGTYDIWFNDLDGSYMFIPVN